MIKSALRKTLLGVAAATALATPVLAQSADWTRQVAHIISTKQTYPRTAQMRGEEGTVKIKLYVGANGAIQKTELVAPSGSSTLDREAMSLPAKLGTLPAPPGGPTAITVPITWRLN